jgi:hypothetical protein
MPVTIAGDPLIATDRATFDITCVVVRLSNLGAAVGACFFLLHLSTPFDFNPKICRPQRKEHP